MAAVGLRDHLKFCQIDGWVELKAARGGSRDHFYYVKELPDGRTLRTKVSHGSKKDYGQNLWKQIWRDQLELSSEDEFWAVLRERRPAVRAGQAEVKREELPGWLVQRLIHSVRMRPDEVATLSVEAAEQRWQDFQMGKPQLAPLDAAPPRPTAVAEGRELAVGY